MITSDTTNHLGTILVVEDNKTVRSKIVRMIQSMGHTAFGAESGQMALDMMRKHDVDIILLDIIMPEMDGYEVLERIRLDKGLCHIPVIVISALNDVKSVLRSMELGADDYLFKPVEQVFLQARINVCLQKKRLHDQEKAYILDLLHERERSERLLLMFCRSLLPTV